MDMFINLKENTENVTITLNGRTHLVKLAGTVDEPYFCGKDICDILEYKDPKFTLQRLVDSDDKKSLAELTQELGDAASPNPTTVVLLGKTNHKPTYHEGKAVYISEPGLYSLVMTSQAPFAKDFRKLVCSIILPSIRKFGAYQVEQQLNGVRAQLALKDKSEAELRQAKENAEREAREAKIKAEKAEKEAENDRQYALRLKEMMVSDEKHEPTQVIYIATSRNYSQQNRFKVGGVEAFDKLKSRLSQYNSRSAQGDDFYFSDTFMVLDYKHIESRLKLLVGRFRDKASKEIYVMHYTNLQYIVKYLCDRFNDDVDDVNEQLSQFIDNLNVRHLRPITPPPKEFKMVSTTVVNLGASGKIDVKAIMSDDVAFVEAVEELIKALPDNVTEVTRKEILDQLRIKTGRKAREGLILEAISKIRPDLRLLKRTTN